MIAKLKQIGAWLLAILAAVGAVFFGVNTYQSKRLQKAAKKAKSEADRLRADAAVEAEKQRQRMREAEANAQKVEELDKRLDALKRRNNILGVMLLVALLAAVACGPARASETPALPSDYAGLAKLYFGALDQIASLKADLEEAVSIAEGYRQAYETEKRLREEAEAAVSRGLERERQLQARIDQQQAVIDKQAATIERLAKGGLVAAVLGALAGRLAGR